MPWTYVTSTLFAQIIISYVVSLITQLCWNNFFLVVKVFWHLNFCLPSFYYKECNFFLAIFKNKEKDHEVWGQEWTKNVEYISSLLGNVNAWLFSNFKHKKKNFTNFSTHKFQLIFVEFDIKIGNVGRCLEC
jgi:hypothetical protein